MLARFVALIDTCPKHADSVKCEGDERRQEREESVC